MAEDGEQNQSRRTAWRAEWINPATGHLGLPPGTEASNSRGNRRPDDWLGSLIMAEANFPVSGLPLSGVNLPTAPTAKP